MAYGTLSDPNNVDKTAEEIKTSKQRSYQFVSDTQGALQDALEDLLYAIDFYCTVYNLAPSGSYTASYVWDDSIVRDTDAIIDKNIKLTQADLRSRIMAIMEINKCTEEEALEEIKRMAEDNQIIGQDVDWTRGDQDESEQENGDAEKNEEEKEKKADDSQGREKTDKTDKRVM